MTASPTELSELYRRSRATICAPPSRESAILYRRKGDSVRQYLIAGLVLFSLGAFVLIRGASFTTKREVLKVGDVQVSADQRQSIPPWVGGLAMVAGVALVFAGTRRRA